METKVGFSFQLDTHILWYDHKAPTYIDTVKNSVV